MATKNQKSVIDDSIVTLAEKAGKPNAVHADDAMKFTQAALNLAHVKSILANIENTPKGAGS